MHPRRLLTVVATSLLLACPFTAQAQNKDSTDTAPGVAPAPATATPAPAPNGPTAAKGVSVPPGDSFLINGDFEQSSTKNPSAPEAWGEDAGITWETEGGKHYLHLVQQTPGKMLMAYREVPLPSGVKAVAFYARYRADNIKLGAKPWFDARTIFHFLDADRKQIKGDPSAIVFKRNGQWNEVTSRFLVPPGAAILQMMPALFQVTAGTLDLAEIRIVPLSDDEANAMTSAVDSATKLKADHEAIIAKDLTLPARTVELKVSGNKLVKPDGSTEWLQGVNVCSLEWSATGDNVLWSIEVATNDWKANCIRLPVSNAMWFGQGKEQEPGEKSQEAYRTLVDNCIKLAGAKGAYVVLDLHRYQAPDQSAIDFWKDAAARYKNNPTVLFDIYNEPTGTTWEVWRNGGDVEKKENGTKTTYHGVGMQALVDAVRSTGANNIIIAGGLDWAYDDSGILKGFALEDKSGNGIMYSVHVYNWKKDWQHKFLDLADKYPLFLGECGANIHKMDFIPAADQEDPYTWVPDLLGLIQKYHLNWTGWCFHTSATPNLLLNWNYEPTPSWGAFAKDALNGKQFELKKLR